MKSWVLIIVLAVSGLFVFGMFKNTKSSMPAIPKKAANTPANDDSTTTANSNNSQNLVELVKQTAKAAKLATAQPKSAQTNLGPLHVIAASKAEISTLGSNDPESNYKLEVKLSGWGAGIYKIGLTDYQIKNFSDDPYIIQQYLTVHTNGHDIHYFPFAAKSIVVNGQTIVLQDQRWQLDPKKAGRYSIIIADQNNQSILKIIRQYQLPQGDQGYDLQCHQTIENLTNSTLNVQWHQYGPADAPTDQASYMGDRRIFISGYHNAEYDPNRRLIFSDKTFTARGKVTKRTSENQYNKYIGKNEHESTLWPISSLDDNENKHELVWVAAVNRYFAVAVHALADQNAKTVPGLDGPNGLFPTVDAELLGWTPQTKASKNDSKLPLVMTMTSSPQIIAPNSTLDLSLGIFTGPRQSTLLNKPAYKKYSFGNLIRYELGCSFFTFQWLARGLLSFLDILHAIIFDWAIAIICLVLVVRTILHPITKRAQVNMAKMGKQMQSIQPEIEKLKKKCGEDKQKFQQEQMKLWREKGINPANMLGCLPMFLQMPIWVALYAMLYFAIELRHQPAFYGIFQAVSNGKWIFLADLSSPDYFIKFANDGIVIPLIFTTITLHAINVLPALMAVMYYFQQKLTMPDATSDQQIQQQKMMKFMTLLFPIFLYNAPSGLTLYILASSTAGIIDSYLVRKHIKEQEASGELFKVKKKQHKPGGLRERFAKMMEAKMLQVQAKQNEIKKTSQQHRSRKKSRK